MNDRIDIKIYYEDTDCGGVVYYANYLGYLERARTEYLENRGVSMVRLMAEGFSFVVVHVDISYSLPAKYGDIISVYSEIENATKATITFNHKVVKEQSDDIIATASVRLACVGNNMKPRRINSDILRALR
ncbi:acyl-CoA thioester hydrolase YbgC [bacterium BMS3Abin07]|nr:acyl-CoA thioester hydrolase YbgC [bacterium BMS3Abin07]GBE32568.1 acyl-CoA thioester hydrolase YbgC [bacterium BMS3Bbin05]HDO22902.1 YbgC/FadM family acyl-CoA thioesterase [Nitrospirota bacterium]HDZ89010.1 YbgC/FadM family acyl-CoA thioesterase [Nitrospirota bacterium]